MIHVMRFVWWIGVVLALGSWLAPPAAAQIGGDEAGWLDRAQAAPLVVVGSPSGATAAWEGGAIWTRHRIRVREVVAGEGAGEIEVFERGGVVDGIGQRVTHQTAIPSDAPALIVLRERAGGGWTPAYDGVQPIRTTASGAELVGEQPLSAVIAAIRGERR